MGMLFRSADTLDMIDVLNEAFDETNLPSKAYDAVLRGWFDNGGGAKTLHQICTKLGLWPTKTPKGKGRWFKFIKDYLPQQRRNEIRAAILHVLNNPDDFKCIRFDAAEHNDYSVLPTDIDTPDGKQIRIITLFTKALPSYEPGEPEEDPG